MPEGEGAGCGWLGATGENVWVRWLRWQHVRGYREGEEGEEGEEYARRVHVGLLGKLIVSVGGMCVELFDDTVDRLTQRLVRFCLRKGLRNEIAFFKKRRDRYQNASTRIEKVKCSVIAKVKYPLYSVYSLCTFQASTTPFFAPLTRIPQQSASSQLFLHSDHFLCTPDAVARRLLHAGLRRG